MCVRLCSARLNNSKTGQSPAILGGEGRRLSQLMLMHVVAPQTARPDEYITFDDTFESCTMCVRFCVWGCVHRDVW